MNFKSRVWASNPPHMFVILVLWLTMTYHCNVTSTTSHEHASTTCVNYVSSAVHSPLIQLILLCVHSYTVDLTTVMEFLLVCTNISTTDFNLSCELPLDSFCDFQNGPTFPRPCVGNSTGFLIQKGSSSNYVAPSTSVCTTVHRSTWLNWTRNFGWPRAGWQAWVKFGLPTFKSWLSPCEERKIFQSCGWIGCSDEWRSEQRDRGSAQHHQPEEVRSKSKDCQYEIKMEDKMNEVENGWMSSEWHNGTT